MAIPLTLGDCLNAEEALTRLAEQPAPPKVSYHVAKLLRLIRAETAHFHEQRNALVRELGAPLPEKASEIAVTPENTATFVTRLNELARVEVAIDWTPLTLAEIDTFPTVRADDLMRLGACLNGDRV